jgi:hypothetical protein
MVGHDARILVALLLAVAVAPPAAAQPKRLAASGPFPRDDVRADCAFLYTTLQAAHYDLYVRTPRADYDRRYRALLDSIQGPMSRLDVVRLFQPFVALGKIGHARISFPYAEYGEYARRGGTLLPFDLRIEGGRAFIVRNYSADAALAPGKELVSLNGRPFATWLDRVGRFISADRPYLAHSQLELMFPEWFWLDQGKVDSFTVRLRSGAEDCSTVSVPAVSATKVQADRAVRQRWFNRRKCDLLSDGVAYLRPGPFYDAESGAIGYDGTAFHRFIDESFRKVIAQGSTDLVLDLRDNHGGDNSFSDPMIAWVATRPFRFASKYTLRASAETRKALVAAAARYPDLPVVGRMQDALRDRADGERVPFEIPEARPRPGAIFRGRVWVLVNRHSYSNAASAAATIQDYKFGLVLGEETSDLPTSYGSAAPFTLPHTGIQVLYPKAYLVRPSGDQALRGVVPDVAIETPLIPTDEDVVLHHAVRIVKERRKH